MKKLTILTLSILMGVSIPFNILLWVSLMKERDQNIILLWENLNLRGYKSAYMEHITQCDSTGNYLMEGLTKEE
jgi:hypothetical protein